MRRSEMVMAIRREVRQAVCAWVTAVELLACVASLVDLGRDDEMPGEERCPGRQPFDMLPGGEKLAYWVQADHPGLPAVS